MVRYAGNAGCFSLNLVRNYWELMDREWNVYLLHTYKDGNRLGDFLAKLACFHMHGLLSYISHSPRLLQLLHETLLGCPTTRTIFATVVDGVNLL